MPTRLLLIRHGQTVHNATLRIAGWTDSPLTAEGWRQAERVAAFLAETESIDVLYASPLQRAWHTATTIGDRLGLAPIRHDDLRELHFGECEDLTVEELQARYPDLWAQSLDNDDPAFRWPGGESRAEFFERVQRAFDAIVGAHPAATIAVVAHGGVLSSYLAFAAIGQPSRWRDYLLTNCSVSEVHCDGGTLQIVRCNVDHFLTPPDLAETVR